MLDIRNTVFLSILLGVFCLLNEATELGDKHLEKIKRFWPEGSSLNLDGSQKVQELFASDVTPIVWGSTTSGGETIAAYLERSNGRALIMPELLVNMMKNFTTDPLMKKWTEIIFDRTDLSAVTFEDATVTFAKAESERSTSTAIVVTKFSNGFTAEALYKDWLDGRVGPILLQHDDMDIEGVTENIVSSVANLFGVFLSRDLVTITTPHKNPQIGEAGFIEPLGLRLRDWISGDNAYNQFPFADYKIYDRAYPKMPAYIEDFYQFMLFYDDLLSKKPINSYLREEPNHPLKKDTLLDILNRLYDQMFATLSQEKLDKFVYDFGPVGGFLPDSGLVEPELGEYIVTLTSRDGRHYPVNLDMKPHSVMEYEVLSPSGCSTTLGLGALYDTVFHHETWWRVPFGRHSVTMKESGPAKFFSPIGGPIAIKTSCRTEVKIRFKNVFRSPGIDIRDPTSWPLWTEGKYNNTKAQYATITCDVIFFTTPFKMMEKYSLQDLKDICYTHDNMVKVFGNYVNSDYMTYDRLHIVYDIQVAYGTAHAGQPIVEPRYWFGDVLGVSNHYFLGKPKGSWWGHIHEVGHMFQPNYFNFGLFGETSNNVLSLMFTDLFLKSPVTDGIGHPGIFNMEKLYNYINAEEDPLAHVWNALHFFYHMTRSFGWALFGNVCYRFTNNPYIERNFDSFIRLLSEETGYNMAPYVYYYRYVENTRDLDDIYESYKHLPTFKPHDGLILRTEGRWNETKQYYGFTNDVQVKKCLPYKFDLTRNLNKISSPSPLTVKV